MMFINAIGTGNIYTYTEIFLANDSTLHSKTIDWIVATKMQTHTHTNVIRNVKRIAHFLKVHASQMKTEYEALFQALRFCI